MDQLIISVYGSHNAAIAMYYKGKYYVVEVERWANIKNSGLVYYNAVRNPQLVFDEITEWLLSHTDGEDVDIYLVGYADTIKPKFKYKKLVRYDHHTAHAATAFYQSPYNEMLTFTFDGGGDGAFFNVYHATRDKGIKLLEAYKQDLGFPYMVLAECLEDIKREDLSTGNLVYAGKLMGLCAYGKVIEEWVPHFNEFYDKFYYDGASYIGGTQVMQEAMQTLFKKIGVKGYVYGKSRYSGELAWNIAATSQIGFENQFYKYAKKFLDMHPNMPIGMSGGCALNVLLNTKLAYERNGNIYVPPNTNDCGMAVGGILWYLNPSEQVDLTYSGLPILDERMIVKYVDELGLSVCDSVSVKELAGYISEGYIVGVVQGNSEHGSRALGNRSILCAPSGTMKDTINHKVKKREWYRPFAPVVKLADVDKYFDFKYESRHMTYAAPIREEWKATIPAVTHEDGTGRLQTVTREQNQLVYDLITEFEALTKYGVLLNTSFNVNGKPILTTIADAFKLLKESELDAVFYKNRLYFKYGQEKPFVSIRKSNGKNITPLNPTDNKPAICFMYNGSYSDKIAEDLTRIKKHFNDIIFVSDEQSITSACYALEWLKSYETGLGKYYHNDRFSKTLKQDEIPNYLKLIWAREVLAENKARLRNVILIDYKPDMNITKIVKMLQSMESTFYTGKQRFVYQDLDVGFGILLGDSEILTDIIDISESIMIPNLYEGPKPLEDRELLKRAIDIIKLKYTDEQ